MKSALLFLLCASAAAGPLESLGRGAKRVFRHPATHCVLQAADYASTRYALAAPGAREANVLTRSHGLMIGLKAGQCASSIVFRRRTPVFAISNGIYTGVVVNNVVVGRRLRQ